MKGRALYSYLSPSITFEPQGLKAAMKKVQDGPREVLGSYVEFLILLEVEKPTQFRRSPGLRWLEVDTPSQKGASFHFS